jgi:hemolysin activation/secretion protein
MYAEAGVWGYGGLKHGDKGYQRAFANFRVYAGDTMLTDIMAALRIGGERIFGDFPSDKAAFLGGGESIRGFPLHRFAGDAALYGSVELRWSIGRWKILIPTEIGMAVGFDAGRVWSKGLSPGPWHTSPVAGIWGAPLSRDLLLFGSIARSAEGLQLRAGAGMDF